MSQAVSRRFPSAIGLLQIAIIVLVAITALIHLQRGLAMAGGGFGGGPGGPPGGGQGGFGGGQGGPPGGGPPGGMNIMQLLPIPLPILFLLNGLGYLALVIALYLPPLARYRRVIRWLLIAFAAVTIVMYFAIAGFRPNPIGIFDKLVEVVLIALLFVEDRQAAQAPLEVAPA
jgi:hypothetical protein